VAKTMTLQHFGGAMGLFQTNFFLQEYFFKKKVKLHGRKLKFAQITMTKIIFKPFFLLYSCDAM